MHEMQLLIDINPRLTRGWLSFEFFPLHKNEKATDPELLGNLFYIFCAHFDGKKWGYHLGWGRVGRQSWEVVGLLQPIHFFKLKVAILKNIMHDVELKLTEYVRIIIIPFYKCKKGDILMFRTFLAKSWIFTHFSRKIAIFSFARDIWSHNFVSPLPILPIVVSMVRGESGDQYLYLVPEPCSLFGLRKFRGVPPPRG